MNLLLDTHVLIWVLIESPLVRPVRHLLADRQNGLLLSSVSLLEILGKHRIGKLAEGDLVTQRLDPYLAEFDIAILPVTAEHARLAGSIPSPHRDPFDRLIAAQSLIEGIPLISRDPAFPSLGVHPIW